MKTVNKFVLLVVFFSILCFGCKNVDSVSPASRNTFIKVFEKYDNYEAQVAEPIDNGYIIGSNLSFSLGSDSYVTLTDAKGTITKEQRFPLSSISTIKVIPNKGGYLVYGDVIHLNPLASNINDQVVTKARVLKLGLDLGVVDSASFYTPGDQTTDFHSTGINIDGNGNYVTSGTKKTSVANSFFQAFVAVYSPSLDTVWTRIYPLLDQDFVNAKNVFTTSDSSILWANSVQQVTFSDVQSYLTVPTVRRQSVYNNYAFLGQTNPFKLSAQEMQAGFIGYGIVGTFSNIRGENGNVFFVRIGDDGKFQDYSIMTFDGVTGLVKAGADAITSTPVSSTEDAGTAIGATHDGGFLVGGTTTSTVTIGNGGKDIWVGKVSIDNTLIWSKTYGGTGDDTVNSIREMPDGSFIMAGGTGANGLVSAYIMRIDATGNLVK